MLSKLNFFLLLISVCAKITVIPHGDFLVVVYTAMVPVSAMQSGLKSSKVTSLTPKVFTAKCTSEFIILAFWKAVARESCIGKLPGRCLARLHPFSCLSQHVLEMHFIYLNTNTYIAFLRVGHQFKALNSFFIDLLVLLFALAHFCFKHKHV